MSSLVLDRSDLLLSQAYIDGEWTGAVSGAVVEVFDPASGSAIASVPDMGAEETKRAVEAANAALPAWRALLAKERAALIYKLFQAMLANQEDLAQILTAECGKPLSEARGEIGYGASFFEWFSVPKHLY